MCLLNVSCQRKWCCYTQDKNNTAVLSSKKPQRTADLLMFSQPGTFAEQDKKQKLGRACLPKREGTLTAGTEEVSVDGPQSPVHHCPGVPSERFAH